MGAAAGLLLHLALQRSHALQRVFQKWRQFPTRAEFREMNRVHSPPRVSVNTNAAPIAGRSPPASPSSGEMVTLRGEVAMLRAQLASARAASETGASSAEARAEVERRLLRLELDEEWGWRLACVEREAQSALVGHLYEKQELQAKHHKALQQAGFDRLDMLAQQEARSKVREGQLFDHALEQVQRLKSQLSERSDGAGELVRLLHAQQRTEDELESLRRMSSSPSSPRNSESAGSPRAGKSTPASSSAGEAGRESTRERRRNTATPPPTPNDQAAEADHRGGGGPTGSSSSSGSPSRPPALSAPSSRPASGPASPAAGKQLPPSPASSHASKAPGTPKRLAAAAAEAAALREQLARAEERLTSTRITHAKEIGQCDEQSDKLRAALNAIEGRLERTESALKTARDAATQAESAKAKALAERHDATRVETDLKRMLHEANARLAALGAPSVGTPSGAPPLITPRSQQPASQSLQQHSARSLSRARAPASSAAAASGGASSSRGHAGQPHIPSISGLAAAANSARAPDVDDDDLLLSQRAFDFLAELPTTAPATPIASNAPSSSNTPRAVTPLSGPSPLSGGPTPPGFSPAFQLSVGVDAPMSTPAKSASSAGKHAGTPRSKPASGMPRDVPRDPRTDPRLDPSGLRDA